MKETTATWIVLFFILLFSCAQVKKVTNTDPPNGMPVLRITNDSAATDIKVTSMSVDVLVASNIAITTFDIEFYNPNDRILEGELEFPLADGQHVIRYALDMDGNLREGVVVEKAKARVAFENTIRRRIDPGLVEKTKGNNFRTRIYPLPAKGKRHIIIATEQILEYPQQDMVYKLPLHSKEPIGKFSVKTSIIKSSIRPVMEEDNFPGFSFEKKQRGWQASFSRENFVANNAIAFSIPKKENEATVLTENYKGETFFYANSCINFSLKKRTPPKTIGLFWDISASGDKRNIEKEKQLLKEYLSANSNVTVSLIPFHIGTLPKENFTITGGNGNQLLKRLSEFQYDGATQFGSIDLTAYKFDEILLFSDGLGTFGKKEIIFSDIPVIAINSSPSADFSFLKYVAKRSNGKFVDLSKLDIQDAMEETGSLSLQVINTTYDPSAIEELVMQVSPVRASGLSFAGKLKSNSATIKVDLGYGNEITQSETFTITRSESSDYDAVKRVWAEMKIAELDLRFELNKDAITKLGKDHSIVTQNTSLIVLDRVEDYVEHEITPPQELQKEYFALLKTKQDLDKENRSSSLDEALAALNDLKEWYNKDHTPRKKTYHDTIVISPDNAVIYADSSAVSAQYDSVRTFYLRGNASASNLEAIAGTMNFTMDSNGDGAYDLVDQTYGWTTTTRNEEEDNAIEMKAWKPDEPYLADLEKTAVANRVAKYFDLKKKYGDKPSFFIDVARFFFEKNEKQFGLQVLSNVAEMKLESAELSRNLANQLMDAGFKDLAIETFIDVMKMREEDPQSYRDLALAYNEAGDHSKAVELLYKVISGYWDTRFRDVKAISINEMNAIISAHSVATNTIDSRFIYPMPLDVRIVISWSSDNTDIDLWVTDPAKEKCDYSHNRTDIGGKMSQDVTQGFGPEEFSLKKAVNGKYKIEVNLFGNSQQTISGPIAIKADLYTNYGKASQKKETIILRVKENKEIVELGTLKFGS